MCSNILSLVWTLAVKGNSGKPKNVWIDEATGGSSEAAGMFFVSRHLPSYMSWVPCNRHLKAQESCHNYLPKIFPIHSLTGEASQHHLLFQVNIPTLMHFSYLHWPGRCLHDQHSICETNTLVMFVTVRDCHYHGKKLKCSQNLLEYSLGVLALWVLATSKDLSRWTPPLLRAREACWCKWQKECTTSQSILSPVVPGTSYPSCVSLVTLLWAPERA